MAAIRSAGVPGLIISPELRSAQVSSLHMTFEPSLGVMARRVDKLGMNIRSFREPLQRVLREIIIPSIAMNFHKHGRDASGQGKAWQPLTTETQVKKGHARPLVDTGDLKATMRRQNIWHLDGEKLLLANLPSDVWYGVIHQEGSDAYTRSGGKIDLGGAFVTYDEINDRFNNVGEEGAIPARPFVRLTNEEVEMVDEVFLDWLDERALRAGWPTTARSKILSGDL